MFHLKFHSFLEEAESSFHVIESERKQLLNQLAGFVKARAENKALAHLIFICTHNSRRSHMGQVAAWTAAARYGVNNLVSWSGGTEATACNPRTVAALERAGLTVNSQGSSSNPVYRIEFGPESQSLEAFSKRFDHPANPSREFCAVMTCDQADRECPVITGAALRLAIAYKDPKEADDTPAEAERYDTRLRQICREMMYAFSRV